MMGYVLLGHTDLRVSRLYQGMAFRHMLRVQPLCSTGARPP